MKSPRRGWKVFKKLYTMEIHTPCSQIGRLNAKMDTPQIPLQMQHNPYQNLPAFLKNPTLGEKNWRTEKAYGV